MRKRRARPGLYEVATAAVVLQLLAVGVSLWFFQIPYYVISPGPTAAVGQLISVPKAHRHGLHGEVLLTTVLQSQAHISDFMFSWAHPHNDLVSSQEIAGNLTASQLQQLDEEEMVGSQEAAEVVALRRDGYTVPEHGTGAQVLGIVKNTPASGKLAVGDTIVAIDATPTLLEQDAAAVLAGHRPGQTITLTVENTHGARRRVSVTLTGRPDNRSQGFLGVELLTRNDHFDFPFKVSINSDGIGGPSAGLAFTLGLLDELTGGNLTNGHLIAATGTMAADGTVGDVGGVAQKTISVADAGASLFLVPPQEYAVARAHAGSHLKVVKVSTFEQALQAVAANGGSLAGLPPAPPSVK